MAERRMFAKTIIDSDAFIDMPLSTQALYFHLSMRADDDGFINNPKKIQRMIGASEDDLKLLIAKRFIIPFDSGIVVIKHWKIHNYIQKDRYKETVYLEEKAMLDTKGNKAYTLRSDTACIQSVSKADTQVRLGKDRVRLGKSKVNDDLSILNRLNDEERAVLEDLCEGFDNFMQLIRYTDAKISRREDDEPISDPYSYLLAVGINDGFIREQ